MPRAYFYGCWNRAGHFLHEPGGGSPQRGTVPDDWRTKFDGSYAPKQTGESLQGQFLLHIIDGFDGLSQCFTVMSWWDCTQGDTRPGCNSTLILEGEHDGLTMVAALGKYFPHAAEVTLR